MKHSLKVIFCFAFTFFCPFVAYAWNAFGHMVVASIAYQRLTPDVREKIDYLVTFLRQEYPSMNSFLEISYWPDAIRMQKIEAYTHWHYIDNGFSNDGTPVNLVLDTDNAVWAINTIEPVVKNSRANPYERVRFLSLLTHIVGDLHQPLHTVTYVSANTPKGDMGGNLYFIRYHDEKINLHRLWDGGVGLLEKNPVPEEVNAAANLIISHYPENFFGKRVNDLKPEDWVREGMDLAKTSVYNTPENQTPSPDYIEANQKLAEQQMALAGYRLAKILNQLVRE